MKQMKIVYFTHSLSSCWNHGNAHFLRGVLRELGDLGCEVTAVEPERSWSRESLVAEAGASALAEFERVFPALAPRVEIQAAGDEAALDRVLDGADLVLVHEWNEPALVAAIGRRRSLGAGFLLLFHDTHHRMVSEPEAMAGYGLDGYDGVLAFGETLTEAYRRQGWGERVFTWHEAADIALFQPPIVETERAGAVWIGNWGDGERSQELRDYMLDPVRELGIGLDIYGVRYPEAAKAELRAQGVRYHGWLANARAPEVFSRHLFTTHVPRRFYVTQLPGIPTIRVFEALACGIPLLCAPWDDTEGLFKPNEDFLQARTPGEMKSLMRDLANDPALRLRLARHGQRTILARHTCRHRVEELLAIVNSYAPLKEGAAT